MKPNICLVYMTGKVLGSTAMSIRDYGSVLKKGVCLMVEHQGMKDG